MSEIDSDAIGLWLPPEDLHFVREKVLVVYVDIIPAHLDEAGVLEAAGMLLYVDDERINRAFPSGHILLCKTIHEALARHIDKDLGPMALPRIPAVLTPFIVGEYFPMGEGWRDSRRHAASLAYVVTTQGDYNPGGDSLEFSWFTPGEARTRELRAELIPVYASLFRRVLTVLSCDA